MYKKAVWKERHYDSLAGTSQMLKERMKIMEISWVWGEGGPHLLMEKRYLDIWETDAVADHGGKESLYDKTGEVKGDYIGELTLQDGSFIVIHEEMDQTAWISGENGNGGILVGSISIEESFDENDFIETITQIPDDVYNETGIQYKIFQDELYLFPACDLGPGYSNPYNKVDLTPGVYKIKIIENYELCYGCFILYKFIKM